jgi:hypothetical protein
LIRALRKLTRGELLVLAALAAWALVPLVVALVDVWRHGGAISGGESFGVADHYEYMAWIREAGEHVLISNRFDVVGDDPVFLQPMWLLSGLGWRAGLPIQAAFLLWKPVAVGLLFWGYRAYVRRMVTDSGPRVAALALALFYVAPLAALVDAAEIGSRGGREWAGLFAFELAPAMYTWGYFPAAVAAGLTPLFLLAVERAVTQPARRWAPLAAAAGLLAAWVHPWQGLVLALLLVLAAGWAARGGAPREALVSLAIPGAALAAPLAYYAALAHWDVDWEQAAGAAGQAHYWRWLALVVAPLALAAAYGWWSSRRETAVDLQELLLRAWPFAIVAVYAALDRGFLYNALQNLSLPLAVLAVRWRPVRSPHAAAAVAAAALVVAFAPGAAYEVDKLHDSTVSPDVAYRLRPGEADALRHIDDSPRSGPVLTRFYLGEAVPAQTGHRVYVGHPIWTPDLVRREELARALLAGTMTRARARALVRETGAAFVLSDCRRRADLRPLLGPLVREVRRFGCATVYEVGPA